MKTNKIMTLVRFGTAGYEDEPIKEEIEQYVFVSKKDALKWLKHYLKEEADDYFSKEQREQIIQDLKEADQYFGGSIYLEQVTCITVE